MAKNKTAETNAGVTAFIEAVENLQRRDDSLKLVGILQEISGYAPRMWGPSIIGFGTYHYKYASGHEGDAPLLGFSPRKDAISLYIYTEGAACDELLQHLGKYKMGKACIYVKKLADIDESILREIASRTIRFMNEKYPRPS